MEVVRRLGPIVFLYMLLALFPVAAMAVTPAGTQIQASSQANYTSGDGTPMPSATSNTVVVTVDYPSGISIGAAKKLPDGRFVKLADSIVTADMGGAFYIEATDRSAGIRVESTQSISEGDLVSAAGILATMDSERQITALEILTASSGNILPVPLGVIQSSLRTGVDGIGLLVNIWGKVMAVPSGSDHFYIDDGSKLQDGSGFTGIKVYGIAPSNAAEKYALVTGISGIEPADTGAALVIRTRQAGDITVLPSP